MKKLLVMILSLCLVLSCVSALADTLTMGTNAHFPPYEYYEGDTIIGIDAEIAGLIAEKLGMELEIIDVEFDTLVAGVEEGKFDIAMAGMTVTEKRLLSVSFSTSYATGIQSIIVPEGSAITSVDDLYAEGASYLIGVQQGTTGDIYCSDDFGEDHVMKYKTGNEAVMALCAGKLDCVIIDDQPAKAYVAANEGLTILDSEYTLEEYAIAISYDKPELLEQVNAALEELIADGTVQAVLDKYITAD